MPFRASGQVYQVRTGAREYSILKADAFEVVVFFFFVDPRKVGILRN